MALKKTFGKEDNYLIAKRKAKQTVYESKLRTENVRFAHVQQNDVAVFKIARQMWQENLYR